jgi:hypothetical protein
MVLHTHGIVMLVFENYLRQVFALDVFPPLFCVLSLHDNHVAAFSTLRQQSSCSSSFLKRGYELNHITSNWYWPGC